MELLILVVIVIGIAIFFAKAKANSKNTPAVENEDATSKANASYEINGPLFTPAERSFYGVLCQASSSDAVVFGKVRIADILNPTKDLGRSEWRKSFNLISAKHFDYVICQPDDLSILSVVELDDSSHSQKDRITRDEFIEAACLSAGLTLHRFKASTSYKIADVRELLFPLSSTEKTGDSNELKPDEPNHDNSESATSMQCPKCSSDLVKRLAQKGAKKGSEFMACSGFPKCRYVKELH